MTAVAVVLLAATAAVDPAERRDYYFGIEIRENEVVWNVRLLERHGLENLTLPDGTVISIVCAARKNVQEDPMIDVLSTRPHSTGRRADGKVCITFRKGEYK